jgi:hypothetical protein
LTAEGYVLPPAISGKSVMLVEPDNTSLKNVLQRYATRYHIAGPAKDRLIIRTADLLASDPERVLAGPMEKAVALTMHEVFLQSLQSLDEIKNSDLT